MGFLDVLGKVFEVVENISAQGGKGMSSLANETMTTNSLSKQTTEQLEEQKLLTQPLNHFQVY